MDKKLSKEIFKSKNKKDKKHFSNREKNKAKKENRRNKLFYDDEGYNDERYEKTSSMGMKTYDSYKRSNVYSFIENFIKSNIGRKYDDVYSELCKKNDSRLKKARYVKRVFESFFTYPFFDKNDNLYWKSKYGFITNARSHFSFEKFYVNFDGIIVGTDHAKNIEKKYNRLISSILRTKYNMLYLKTLYFEYVEGNDLFTVEIIGIDKDLNLQKKAYAKIRQYKKCEKEAFKIMGEKEVSIIIKEWNSLPRSITKIVPIFNPKYDYKFLHYFDEPYISISYQDSLKYYKYAPELFEKSKRYVVKYKNIKKIYDCPAYLYKEFRKKSYDLPYYIEMYKKKMEEFEQKKEQMQKELQQCMNIGETQL